jgi:hypothetical protein
LAEQTKRQLHACILILVFAFYYVNISFFYHSHTINRITILHSHLHGTNHNKTNPHSDSELSLITALSLFHSLQATICAAGAVSFPSFLTLISTGTEEETLAPVYGNPLLRAPPALL